MAYEATQSSLTGWTLSRATREPRRLTESAFGCPAGASDVGLGIMSLIKPPLRRALAPHANSLIRVPSETETRKGAAS